MWRWRTEQKRDLRARSGAGVDGAGIARSIHRSDVVIRLDEDRAAFQQAD